MKLAIKLAFRNLIGAGLRTWLNVIVLSFSFIVIIWMKGIITGWDHQAKVDMTNWQIGEGQYWQKNYDPYDPFTINESHAPVPVGFLDEIEKGEMEPVLIAQGSIYPQGRLQSIMIKGINPGQKLFLLPVHKLDTVIPDAIPSVIGSVMARNLSLDTGDRVMIQWRDTNGTFDAAEIYITEMFLRLTRDRYISHSTSYGLCLILKEKLLFLLIKTVKSRGLRLMDGYIKPKRILQNLSMI